MESEQKRKGGSLKQSNGETERTGRTGSSRTADETSRANGDSDLLNGTREMSSDNNQMIHKNNNLENNKKAAAAAVAASSTESGPVKTNNAKGGKEELSGPKSSTRETNRFVGPQTAALNHQDSQTRKQAAAFLDSSPIQHKQQRQQARCRAKIIKSKSSPSSLTTHKFGLRPTPSPPRLMIDHQTGDIVESYPEHPVYLRTYQPIEADEDDDQDQKGGDEAARYQLNDLSAAQSSFTAVAQYQMDDSLLNLGNEDHFDQQSRPNQTNRNNIDNHHQQNHHRTPHQMNSMPTPPHAASRVYFAPPATSSSPFGDQPPPSAAVTASSRARARASFRRAINQLTDTAERTDIAIVTEPDNYDRAQEEATVDSATATKPFGQMRVTATSASRGDALLAAQHQRRQQPSAASSGASKLYSQPSLRRTGGVGDKKVANQQQYQSVNGRKGAPQHGGAINQPPAIEDFCLYNFCYYFRVLLVLLLSSSIIYLLVVTLHADCTKYRPSPTYVSIITSSVNVISVTIFTLFWYCSGVTRTLYQNISASAFIVTIYSILVCINLALAIIFFFIDTCHLQKVVATHSALADWERFSQLLTDDAGGFVMKSLHYDQTRRQREEQVALEAIQSIELLLDSMQTEEKEGGTKRQHSRRQAGNSGQQGTFDDPNVIDDQLGDPNQPDPTLASATSATTTTTTSASDLYMPDSYQVPPMSPIEAAWEYLKERAHAFARNFYRFLIYYDLKFIGALHALLAACFQYLAIKVAIVRSYFTTSSVSNF